MEDQRKGDNAKEEEEERGKECEGVRFLFCSVSCDALSTPYEFCIMGVCVHI